MELSVHVEDLSQRYRDLWDQGHLPLRDVRFPMFEERARQAIILVGSACFRVSGGGYERIAPSQKMPKGY